MGETPDSFTIKNNEHSCPECSKQCKECKEKILKAESKILKMTIALTASFTLLGKEAVEFVIEMVNNTEKIVDNNTKEENKNLTDVTYKFGKKNDRIPNFSSHYDPINSFYENEENKKEIFLADTKKYANPIENKNYNSMKWIYSSPKELGNEYYSLVYDDTNKNEIAFKANDVSNNMAFSADSLKINNIEFSQGIESINYQSSNITIPNPGTLCILAFGGMIHNRSR